MLAGRCNVDEGGNMMTAGIEIKNGEEFMKTQH
jgi:hypothetical protein